MICLKTVDSRHVELWLCEGGLRQSQHEKGLAVRVEARSLGRVCGQVGIIVTVLFNTLVLS